MHLRFVVAGPHTVQLHWFASDCESIAAHTPKVVRTKPQLPLGFASRGVERFASPNSRWFEWTQKEWKWSASVIRRLKIGLDLRTFPELAKKGVDFAVDAFVYPYFDYPSLEPVCVQFRPGPPSTRTIPATSFR